MAKVNKAKVQDDTSVGRYKVLSPLRHDGDNYAVDETVELTEKQAAPLLGVNAVTLIKAAKTDSKTDDGEGGKGDDPNKKPEGDE